MLLLCACSSFYTLPAQIKKPVYLFSYFVDNGQDGLHLAYSKDGYNWNVLNEGQSFLQPLAGKDKLMRDPCILRGPDGTFHMVWTVSWNEKGIGYASSTDLIHWTPQRYLPVMEHESTTLNCWAPELNYDASTGNYMLYWSSTIPGRFPDTETSGDKGYNHRVYYSTTQDLRTFSRAEVLYDPGFNSIDASIVQVADSFVMFIKNETKYPEPEKNIRMTSSKKLQGPYLPASSPITQNWVEGPSPIQSGKDWLVYFDRYTEHKMGAVRSSDLVSWEDVSDQIHFPEGVRHGTVIAIYKRELRRLQKIKP